jgi:hypothetical protein
MLAYAATSLLINLLWESVQLPLYTLWSTASAGELVFAVIHCTGGDVVIASASLALAMLLWGGRDRSPVGPRIVAAAIGLGLAYTFVSEWLNVYVRKSWAYSDWMPVLPGLGIGLSPLLQWLIVPALSFAWVGRRQARAHASL